MILALTLSGGNLPFLVLAFGCFEQVQMSAWENPYLEVSGATCQAASADSFALGRLSYSGARHVGLLDYSLLQRRRGASLDGADCGR